MIFYFFCALCFYSEKEDNLQQLREEQQQQLLAARQEQYYSQKYLQKEHIRMVTFSNVCLSKNLILFRLFFNYFSETFGQICGCKFFFMVLFIF